VVVVVGKSGIISVVVVVVVVGVVVVSVDVPFQTIF
jgi:hypothetical protein